MNGFPCPKPAFKPLRTVAVTTRPRLGAVLVSALGARVRVLDVFEVEELFPVRALFRERRCAEAGLHPLYAAVRELARLRHVAEVLVAGDRALAERAILDRAPERLKADFISS